MSDEFHVRRWAFGSLRKWGKHLLPEGSHEFFRPLVRSALKLYNLAPTLSFVLFPPQLPRRSYLQRVRVAYLVDRVSRRVKCSHSEEQMMRVFWEVLSVPADTPGCIVEAGCFKGGSAAKFSILAKMTNRRLILFDSFEGLPENQEYDDDEVGAGGVDLRSAFAGGTYSGGIDEVKQNIERYGCLDVCAFNKGWFDDTMPSFSEEVCVAYIDVDLASSTRTCIRFLYPLLVPGGSLLSQDGHIPLVVDVFRDQDLWKNELGVEAPEVEGMGTDQMLVVRKAE